MRKKAIILDLDNTIYSVHSIGHILFQSLFDLIGKNGNHDQDMDKIKGDLMRRPFQLVARDYHFNKSLIQDATHLLQHLTYNGLIEFYPDYLIVRSLEVNRYLVTTGFQKLQQSKIDALNLAGDFGEIHIIDPSVTAKTKKDVFTDIIQRYEYDPSEVLVIGDDPHSEIKAARELNIEALLYNRNSEMYGIEGMKSIQSFQELGAYL